MKNDCLDPIILLIIILYESWLEILFVVIKILINESDLTVPHFEKMLYDQGQLANVYLDVFSITKDVFYSCVARDILDYLKREMIGPDGEIFSAEDADSAESGKNPTKKKEGAFYVWTATEVCNYMFWLFFYLD